MKWDSLEHRKENNHAMSAEKYHAVQFIRKEEAQLTLLERDQTPLGNNEIEGRTLFSLISPGTEVVGVYAGGHFQINENSYPMKSGYASVFQVGKVGGGVRSFKPGDVVFAANSHQSIQRVHERDAIPVPDGLDPKIALFARFAKIPMPAYVHTRIRPPEKVIVAGLGIVGMMAAQLGRIYGYDVIACDPNEQRQALAKLHGIETVVPAVPDVGGKQNHEKAGLGIDCSGHEMAVLDLCKAMRIRGEVFLVGVPWIPRTNLTAQRILHEVFYNYLSLQSGWEGEMPPAPAIHSEAHHLARALDWLAQGKLKVSDTAFEVVSPKNPQEQYQDILHNRMKTLSIVFDWRNI